ncbi:MAG TPA: hypothetical protein VIX17_07445 [Pyrinomonadaceae bacterium]
MVSTCVLNQAVSRMLIDFTKTFCFGFTKHEVEEWEKLMRLRSQMVTLKKAQGTQIKYKPVCLYRAWNPHAVERFKVAASNSSQHTNHAHLFRLREMLASNAALIQPLDELENNYDVKFKIVVRALRKPICKGKCHPRQQLCLNPQHSVSSFPQV